MSNQSFHSHTEKLTRNNYNMSSISNASKKAILVVGATSTIGSGVAKSLSKLGASTTVLVRSEEKGKSFKEEGINVAVGDLAKPETLGKAFKGIDTAFILTPPSELAPGLFSNALWAAKQAGVKHIVRISAVKAAHDAPTINSRSHALSDSELITSGIKYTIIKPHFFMQNLLMATESVKSEGKIYLPFGEGALGMIDSRDIVDFSVKTITDAGHDNKVYTITGPESINLKQVAASLSKVINKPVEYVAVALDTAIEQMKQSGVDQYTLNLLHDYFEQYSQNWGNFVTSDSGDCVSVDFSTLEKEKKVSDGKVKGRRKEEEGGRRGREREEGEGERGIDEQLI